LQGRLEIALDATSSSGSGLPVPSRRTFAPGILPCAHSTQARFGILPLARLQGRLEIALDATSCVGRGCPCPSRRTFAPGILPCAHSTQARFGILPLARLRGRRDGHGQPRPLTLSPIKAPWREPGDCGNKGQPAIHAAPHTRHRLSLAVSNCCATSQSPSLRWGLLLRHAGRTGSRASPLARLRGRRDWHGQPSYKPRGASPGTAGIKATPLSMPPHIHDTV